MAKVVYWTRAEDKILLEELARGAKDWTKRAEERLPGRTFYAVKKRGLALQVNARPIFPLWRKGEKPRREGAPAPCARPTRTPLADRIPDFLKPDFRRFGVAV